MKAAYPAKILLAWAKALEGNRQIEEWLLTNGYRELALFVYAVHNKPEARKWLLENGFPHLLACIETCEGRPQAARWLDEHGFDVLKQVGLAADGDEEAQRWLLEQNLREFALIARRMQVIKDQIEIDNNDVHKISKD